MKIGIISDTHNYLHNNIFDYFKDCDEVWHAGDIGSIKLLERLKNKKKTIAVYGNIDDEILRKELDEYRIIEKGNIKFLIIHIAGKPPKYNDKTIKLIKKHNPNVIVCGHSHILKIEKDQINNLLFINPGAAGKIGLHKMKTIIRFCIKSNKIKDMEVIEFL